MSVSMTSTLINHLDQYGVVAQVIDGQLKVKLPEPLPLQAKPLLKELKKVTDQEQAYRLFENASVRVSKAFSSVAWEWAKSSKPELVNAILTAEQDFSTFYREHDMTGCREAVERYKKGFITLNEAYTQREPDT